LERVLFIYSIIQQVLKKLKKPMTQTIKINLFSLSCIAVLSIAIHFFA